jgi:hypothetical protein
VTAGSAEQISRIVGHLGYLHDSVDELEPRLARAMAWTEEFVPESERTTCSSRICGGVSRAMRSCQSGTIDRAWQTSAGDVCCDRVEMVSTRSVPVRRILAGLRHGPYAVPRPGESLRFAQVGQSTYFEACSLDDSLDGIETVFADFRAGADPTPVREALERFAPHVVLVFRPEIVPEGFFSGLAAATVGFLTEPLPRAASNHPDLRRRLSDLKATDPGNFDRLVSFDPLIAESAAGVTKVWRSMPLPVADRLYAPLRRQTGRPQALFVGRSTPHREKILVAAKHKYDVLHVAHGADVEMLEALLAEHDVGINLHNEPYPSFENRVCLHLAAGHLVLSERLSPPHGLEPGIDFVEIATAEQLLHVLQVLETYPGTYDRIRSRGRAKAELYRASVVYPRLIHDLYLDLAAFGTGRRA